MAKKFGQSTTKNLTRALEGASRGMQTFRGTVGEKFETEMGVLSAQQRYAQQMAERGLREREVAATEKLSGAHAKYYEAAAEAAGQRAEPKSNVALLTKDWQENALNRHVAQMGPWVLAKTKDLTVDDPTAYDRVKQGWRDLIMKNYEGAPDPYKAAFGDVVDYLGAEAILNDLTYGTLALWTGGAITPRTAPPGPGKVEKVQQAVVGAAKTGVRVGAPVVEAVGRKVGPSVPSERGELGGAGFSLAQMIAQLWRRSQDAPSARKKALQMIDEGDVDAILTETMP